jgi:protein involved in polysaccharide export with SLBB domain
MQMSRAFNTAVSVFALLLCGAAVSQEAEVEVKAAKGTALDAGDLVFINVHRQPELSTTTQLDANGNVEVPYIGNVTLKGSRWKRRAHGCPWG